jgi:hypothetical protein
MVNLRQFFLVKNSNVTNTKEGGHIMCVLSTMTYGELIRKKLGCNKTKSAK